MKRAMRIALVLLALAVVEDVEAQMGKVTVRVIAAETGMLITSARVTAGFGTRIKPGWGWGGGKPNRVEGVTDEDGLCTLAADGNGGSVGVTAFKDGYYPSGGYSINFTNLTGLLVKRWEPWNPTVEVEMKKIGNPIPMYAKGFHGRLPVEGKPVAYDLEAGDWVKPHGNGEVSDFVLLYVKSPDRTVPIKKVGLHGKDTTVLYERSLKVSVSNDGDGFVPHPLPLRGGGSSLCLPREAPAHGYQPSITKRYYRDDPDRQSQSTIREDQNYFFRVRTQKDEAGQIISALYGKMHGDFTFNYHGEVTFRYHLNPIPNDRNVEFDPDRNLFPNEDVRQP